jgi:hypothetical protein
MKLILKLMQILSIVMGIFIMSSCSKNDDAMQPKVDSNMGEAISETASKSYNLGFVSNSDISGTAKFITFSNDSTVVELNLNNTVDGAMHPAHIHFNTAAEGGDITITLEAVDGSTGKSSTPITVLENGTAITYAGLLEFDGYINVHQSMEDLGTLIAQGDIGQNELTGTSKIYALNSISNPNISGTATFSERVNGEALATIALSNTTPGTMHPGHIHFNTAAEGGDIALDLIAVNGDTGISKTNIGALNDGTTIGYEGLLTYDGYINIHNSMNDLGTLIAQGDIGQNELTGASKVYPLNSVSDPTISGTATFEERVSGEALATIELSNTTPGAMHPGHIHFNTAAEGGDIALDLIAINGDTGISKTNIGALNNGTVIGYEGILTFDGYINIHNSMDDLGTLIAQGDIGQNELSGKFTVYVLNSVSNPTISGTATFEERINSETLVTVALINTLSGDMHPGHIHVNSAAEGGSIAIDLITVNGDTGMSKTNISALNDGTVIDYETLLVFDGYINIHESMTDLGTLIAQGNIGINIGSETNNKTFDVTNNGTTSYIFNGGTLSDAENIGLTLVRGETYTFNINANGHPFLIKTVQGNTTGNAYNSGVTNNGTQTGSITFTVPMDAPAVLYYNCQFHSSMTGMITIID